ncbi:MAG: thioredoxin family protein [Acidimicrobiales bacterium]
MRVTLQYFEDCPNWRIAEARLREALVEVGHPDHAIDHQRVESAEEAERVGFGGSPTILIDGIDPFADPAGPAGYACRVYSDDAAPTVAQLRQALVR